MMKNIKYAILLSLLSLASTRGFCDDVVPWDDKSSSAITRHIIDATESEYITNAPLFFFIEANIAHGGDGIKRMYFSAHGFVSKDKMFDACSPSKQKDTEIIYFNKQAIKVFSWCKKYHDSDSHYIQYSPATDEGSEYVINLFKHKSGNITTVLPEPDIKIELSTENFMKVWNGFGGNAL